MYRSEMMVRLSFGMSTPRIRGIRPISVGQCRGISALPLLVAGVLADHVHLAPAANDLAALADALHARSDLHRPSRSLSRRRRRATGRPLGPNRRADPSLARALLEPR